MRDGYWFCSFLVRILVFVALFLPATHYVSGQPPVSFYGFMLALFGWFGALQFDFAWFANIPLWYCAARMASGSPPKKPLAWAAACLALTVLLPHCLCDFAQHSYHIAYLKGPAVGIWLVAVGITLVAAHARSFSSNESER